MLFMLKQKYLYNTSLKVTSLARVQSKAVTSDVLIIRYCGNMSFVSSALDDSPCFYLPGHDREARSQTHGISHSNIILLQ